VTKDDQKSLLKLKITYLIAAITLLTSIGLRDYEIVTCWISEMKWKCS